MKQVVTTNELPFGFLVGNILAIPIYYQSYKSNKLYKSMKDQSEKERIIRNQSRLAEIGQR